MSNSCWISEVDEIKRKTRDRLESIVPVADEIDEGPDWLISAATCGGIHMEAKSGAELLAEIWNEGTSSKARPLVDVGEAEEEKDDRDKDDEKDDEVEDDDEIDDVIAEDDEDEEEEEEEEEVEEEEKLEEVIRSPMTIRSVKSRKFSPNKQADDGGCCLTSFDLWRSLFPDSSSSEQYGLSLSDIKTHQTIFLHMTDLLSNECFGSINSSSLIEKLTANFMNQVGNNQKHDSLEKCLRPLYDDDAVGGWFIDPLSKNADKIKKHKFEQQPDYVRILYRLPPEDGDDEVLWVAGSLHEPAILSQSSGSRTAKKYPTWDISEWDANDLNSAYKLTSAAHASGSLPATMPPLFASPNGALSPRKKRNGPPTLAPTSPYSPHSSERKRRKRL